MKIKMKTPHKFTSNIAATGTAVLAFMLLATVSNAATVLINEDWQDPDVAANLRLDDTSTFAGWRFTQGNGNIFRSVDTPANGLPGGIDGTANQALQFEWSGSNAEYDTTHAWSASDEFSLSFNATEMNWGNANERYVRIEITETVRNGSGDLIGTMLLGQNIQLAQYDTAHDAAADDWSAAQTFNFNFSGADFTGGTAGSLLTFEIGSIDPPGAGAGRGLYVDNINLTLVPEPSVLSLIGLGALGLLFRRRRK